MACSSVQTCVSYLVEAVPGAKDFNVIEVRHSHKVLDLLDSLREEHFFVMVLDVAAPIGIELCANHIYLLIKKMLW
jgi:hypothetical protein